MAAQFYMWGEFSREELSGQGNFPGRIFTEEIEQDNFHWGRGRHRTPDTLNKYTKTILNTVITKLQLLTTTDRSTKPPEANTVIPAPPSAKSIHSLPLYNFPFPLDPFYDILPPQPQATCFHFSPRRLVEIDNLLSFIRRKGPAHLKFSLIIALKSGIEPYFSYSYTV